jgi:hypothetical protein
VLGAWSELTLWHADAAFAQRTIRKVRQEIERYERIFSLYRRTARSRVSMRLERWHGHRPSCARSLMKASAWRR